MTAVVEPMSAFRASRPIPFSLVAGCLVLLPIMLCALIPQHIAPYDPLVLDFTALLQPPSVSHWFGTDNFGRDLLSRTIWAARIDLQIALFSTIAPLLVGTVVGALVAYYEGWADAVLGCLVNVVVTIPFVILVIGVVAVLGPGLFNMYLAMGVVNWIFYARLVRAEILVQKHQDYAAAGRVMGYGDARIIFRHLLPNTVTPILTYWVTDMALAILLGSSLGYLGLGVQPPTAEWGVLIADGKNFLSTAWWMSVCPGLAIVVTGIGFSLVGDGVAALMRPRR